MVKKSLTSRDCGPTNLRLPGYDPVSLSTNSFSPPSLTTTADRSEEELGFFFKGLSSRVVLSSMENTDITYGFLKIIKRLFDFDYENGVSKTLVYGTEKGSQTTAPLVSLTLF
ncbi:MAG: hypothetical protein ISR95_03225 [Candidatus Marinimicrobia bacterium]|nr:hypothetical protein [Candidatus Neomarinimicrobiota bacterium]